jgi:hypothetical protein
MSVGALVSLAASGADSVSLADVGNAGNLVGVASEKPVLELSDGSSSSIKVVVSGVAEALVSDVNGEIKAGDKITPSPISGVGMKAMQSGEIVGTAQKALGSVSSVKQQVTSADGKQETVNVGLLPIAVNVVYFSTNSASGSAAAFVPPFLQSVANAVTGKQVPPLRVLLGGLALLLGFIGATAMLIISIKSGMISIGRNPLAEKALRRGLFDVIIAAMGVLTATVVVVYAILLA